MEILGIILFVLLSICWVWYSLVKRSETLDGFATSKIFFTVLFGIAFLPLLIFFLFPFFIEKFLLEGDSNAFLSAFLFVGFAVSYTSKLIVQSKFLRDIQSVLLETGKENDPEVQQRINKLKQSYLLVVILSPLILSGIIPLVHLLTIWIAIPSAMILPFLYPEGAFFYSMSRYLSTSTGKSFSTQLFLLTITLGATFIFAPLLYFALDSGLKTLGLGSGGLGLPFFLR